MSRIDIKKNNLSQTLWVLIIIITTLILLSLIPKDSLESFGIKKIDILSDLRADTTTRINELSDTLFTDTKTSILSSTGNPSPTSIEDFSNDGSILKHFYDALKKVNNEQVRIAFYGDSFIEGDIISASMRDTLQRIFGGNGVGLVPLASETAGFRKSIKHTYSNWDTYSLLNIPDGIPIGISGYTYIPKKDNNAVYKPGKIPAQKNFNMIRVLYQNATATSLHYRINDGPELSQELDQSGSLSQVVIKQPDIQSFQLAVRPTNEVFLFGVSFENKNGIYVDNFSMRRNSGTALAKLSPELLKQFNTYLNYKLIILQYGLNVASENDSTNYFWYTSKMIKIIDDLKAVFPRTSFLLLSVSDRGANKAGRIVTMEAITKMRNMQREVARKSGIAFWDMFEAMGGKNSIASYTDAEPPLAAKDYTHLTHLGGNIIGRKLADALLHEIKKHENNNNAP